MTVCATRFIVGIMLTPKTLVIAALALFAVLAVLRVVFLGRRPNTGVYYAKKSLFTPAERSFLSVLEAVLSSDVRVFGKVRLEDVIGVKSGLERDERQAARNRITSKHVDFLLVRARDLAPLAGIELDDSSHEREDRRQRDEFVDAAFASANLPLLHVTVKKSYDPAELEAAIDKLLA